MMTDRKGFVKLCGEEEREHSLTCTVVQQFGLTVWHQQRLAIESGMDIIPGFCFGEKCP